MNAKSAHFITVPTFEGNQILKFGINKQKNIWFI